VLRVSASAPVLKPAAKTAPGASYSGEQQRVAKDAASYTAQHGAAPPERGTEEYGRVAKEAAASTAAGAAYNARMAKLASAAESIAASGALDEPKGAKPAGGDAPSRRRSPPAGGGKGRGSRDRTSPGRDGRAKPKVSRHDSTPHQDSRVAGLACLGSR